MSRQTALGSLRFFEAAARLGSFVQAADELHVTHGAVSRQIRLLETSLGTALFERRNRGVFLTAPGAQLRDAVQQAFERLDAALEAVRQPARPAPLVVSCEPTIAMKWLIPRLGDFYRRHPEVPLHLFASGGPVAFQRDAVDVALRRNDFAWDGGLHVEKVCDEWIAPVCAPALLRQGRLDLSVQRLLHTASRPAAWAHWRAAGTDDGLGYHGDSQTYEHFYLSLQAACAGLGVAIGSIFMAREDLDSGRLVAPLGFRRDGSGYFLLSPLAFDGDARRTALLHWLREQMGQALPAP
ncbi:LysR family transcriptional regulator [Janthinobacterium sp. GW460P]|uniref:LysR substrate-binding domain-containing protein n=1 Tax=unclassified Janthinobacterium TaxID=2610881 RepID=UPI000A31FA1E|nr:MULTISPECIES: LysR substrate-binding domain-containing protein [unclassified Janthinobacterium]MCC7702831.1 LysR family transcriptional regulator [Janthinobacterium sp. GW460P]MCC7708339.1 LysR family transcriptional regulator [Janthinobacterium sp. GW460W]